MCLVGLNVRFCLLFARLRCSSLWWSYSMFGGGTDSCCWIFLATGGLRSSTEDRSRTPVPVGSSHSHSQFNGDSATGDRHQHQQQAQGQGPEQPQQQQQQVAQRSRWQAMLLEAGGLSAALSEDSMRRLKYCLQWLQVRLFHPPFVPYP